MLSCDPAVPEPPCSNPNPDSQNSVPDQGRWALVVERIQTGDESAMEELYRTFSRGIRYYICRMLGAQEIDDKVHDTFVIVVQAIRRGELRDPARLPGFVRTVVRRQVAASIDRAIQSRKDSLDVEGGVKVIDDSQNPEESVIRGERNEIMREALLAINVRDREILTRYYVYEHSQQEICADLGLTETQFRLLKSRAKARFGELGKKKLMQRSLTKLFMRKSDASGH